GRHAAAHPRLDRGAAAGEPAARGAGPARYAVCRSGDAAGRGLRGRGGRALAASVGAGGAEAFPGIGALPDGDAGSDGLRPRMEGDRRSRVSWSWVLSIVVLAGCGGGDEGSKPKSAPAPAAPPPAAAAAPAPPAPPTPPPAAAPTAALDCKNPT